MKRLSINEVTTFRWSFDEDVMHYAAAGIKSIGVWRPKVSDFGEEKAAELLADTGLAVSNLLWTGGFTGHEGRTFRESVEDALEAIRLAGMLKARNLIVYSGPRNRHTENHAKRLVKWALAELAPAADSHGVTLAFEPMHPVYSLEWTFLNDVDQTLDLIDEAGCPQVKLAFDSFHLGRQPALLERMPELAPRIGIVHLGDSKAPPQREQNRCRLGEGDVPLRSVVDALVSAGYRGYFDVELMGEEIETCNYQELIQHSKQAFAQLITRQPQHAVLASES